MAGTVLHYLSPEEESALKRSIPWARLDRHVRDLVRKANTIAGLATVQSCAGHIRPNGEGFNVSDASLTFRCDQDIAHRVLFSDAALCGISDVSVRYFDSGTFWLTVTVDPADLGKLDDLVNLLRTQKKTTSL